MLTNEELSTSFKIRTENHNEVQRLLNEINQILFRAQRLRGLFTKCAQAYMRS
jgi:Ciliary BBSome complex subunit 2, C-terminal